MKPFAPPVLAFFVLSVALSRAAVVATYSSGAAPGSPGAGADPQTQGWTKNTPFIPTTSAAVFSDGAQGWRTVDSTGIAAAFYRQDFTESEMAGIGTAGFTIISRLKFDSDLLNNGITGPVADDYFLPPNQARQNGVLLRFATTSFQYSGLFNVDAASNLYFNDGSSNHQLTTDGSAYDNYKEFVMSAHGGAPATLSLDGTTVTLNSAGPQGFNQFVFGTAQAGQGSAVWSFVYVQNNHVPEPGTGSLVALGCGLAMRYGRRLRLGGGTQTEGSTGTRRRRFSAASRTRLF
jgi:hypothetical protein